MPDRRHHDPHIEGKLVGAALLEELAFEEHAGPLAELNDRARHALVSEGKMRRGIESDGVTDSLQPSLRCTNVPIFGKTVPIFTRIFTSFSAKPSEGHKTAEVN